MKKQNNTVAYLQQRPILIGFFAVAMVLMLGFSMAYATGLTVPSQAKADDFTDGGSIDIGSLGTTGLSSPDVISGGLTDVTSNPNDAITSGLSSIGDTSGSISTSVSSDPISSTVSDPASSNISNPVSTDSTPVTDTVTPPTETTGTAPCNCDNVPSTVSTDSTPATDTVTPPTETTGTAPCNCDNVPPAVTTDNPTPPTETTGTIPCNCGGTAVPPDTTTPPDTTLPPIDTPPVVITPLIVQVCPTGDTGTYPNCVAPTPPPAQVCPTGDTGTYPNCVGPTPPPAQVCPTGDTGTYPDCVAPTPPPAQVCPAGDTGTYPNCVVPTNGGGCVSGCGGITIPSGIIPVVFSGGGGGVSGQVILPHAPVAQVASVYLSQIPYTGLDLGPVGTVVYWVALIIFCLTAAYLLIFKLIPFISLRLQSFGLNVHTMLNQPGSLAVAGAAASAHGHSQSAQAHVAHAPPSHASNYPQLHPQTYTPSDASIVHSVAAPTKPNPSAYSAVKGFSSFAQGETLTIDDIVNGLARLPEVQTHSHTLEEDVVVPTYQSAEDIIASHQMQPPAMPAQTPQTTRKEEAARVISTDVRDFCAALLHGDRDTVFGTLRQIVREGGDAEMFLTQVVCALDDAYRNRLDGTAVNAEIVQLTQNCATSFLERLTGALTNAVDSSYSPGITGSKLALTRALAVVEG